MTRLRIILYLIAGVLVLVMSAKAYWTDYWPEGWEIYAEHFRSLPEVETFHSEFPDARPARTLIHTYPVGYESQSGEVVMGILHDRFSFEPGEIVISCWEPDTVLPDSLSGIKTYGCGEYPDGFGPYTDAFAELGAVRAFLDEYPGALPGFVHGRPGFSFSDPPASISISVEHEPGSPEPEFITITCHPEDGHRRTYEIENFARGHHPAIDPARDGLPGLADCEMPPAG